MGFPNTEGMRLKSILNMDNMKEGGFKTEYGLYALSSIVKDQHCYDSEALEILGDLSKLNFHELNTKNHPDNTNEDIIIDVMYQVADDIAKSKPAWIDKIYKVMLATEGNNNGYVNERGHSRKAFMDTYRGNTIDMAKERMLNRRTDRQGTIEKTVSGTVVADKIADGIRSGVITESVTPQKGKELSENVKRKYAVDKIRSGKY